MSNESARDELARDIFIADNHHAPEEQMLREWAEGKHRDGGHYAYAIADGLIAKGYRKDPA